MVKINTTTFKPECELYKRCNGCQLQNMEYTHQLKWKQYRVDTLLSSFCHVNKIIGMANPLYYRNKLTAVYRTTKNKELISGIYQSSNNGIVATDSCKITDTRANEISATLRRLFKSFKIKPYNYSTGNGYVKNVVIRCSYQTDEIMVLIVVGRETNLFNQSFINALIKTHPQIKSVTLNFNENEKVLNGRQIAVLYGNGKINTKICDCSFMISPDSFYQVNSLQTEVLYSKAIEMASLKGDETVIDAYCGTGTIGIISSKRAKKVIGVELNSVAIEDAKHNATLNGALNTEFYCDDAGNFMYKMAEEDRYADVVFVDPPRAGCTMKFLISLCKLSPDRIVYVSCNPETLARDLRFLVKKGYSVKEIQPVDMFPFTKGIECVACIEKR